MLSGFVKNSSAMWELYQVSKAYSVRPSTHLGVEDPWLAYCLNQAVFYFGRSLENELEKQDGKTAKEIERKRERVLAKWLDKPQRFRAPVATNTNVEEQHTVKGLE